MENASLEYLSLVDLGAGESRLFCQLELRDCTELSLLQICLYLLLCVLMHNPLLSATSRTEVTSDCKPTRQGALPRRLELVTEDPHEPPLGTRVH